MARPRTRPLSSAVVRLMNALGARSLRELANVLDANYNTVRNWQGRDRIPEEWVKRASEIANVPVELLSDGSNLREVGSASSAAVAPLGNLLTVDVHFVAEPRTAWRDAVPDPVRPDIMRMGGAPPKGGTPTASDGALLPSTNEVEPLVLTVGVGQAGRKVDYEVIPKMMGAAHAGALPAEPGASQAVRLDRVGELAMSFEWLGRNLGHTTGELATIQVHGDSMTPTLLDGDTIIIDRGVREASVDGIYVIEMLGKRLVKRLQTQFDETLVIISDNKAYKEQTIPRGRVREIAVIGRMVWPRVR